MRVLLSRIAIGLSAFALGVGATNVEGVFRSLTLQQIPTAPAGAALAEPPSNTTHTESEPVAAEPEWKPPTSRPHAARVLEVGEYHGEEVNARTGEKWLGLYVTGRGSSLSDSILQVAAIKDEIVDDDTSGVKTGKRVSVNRKPDPILLINRTLSLRRGPVSTVFAGRLSLGNASDVSFSMGGASYNLHVSPSEVSHSSYISPSISRDDAKLILTRNEKTAQEIYDLKGTGRETEAYWQLLWAGDLDGDNRLDLYVQVGYHYNMTQRKLFLSSRAKKSQLVREVAELTTWGC